MTGLSSLHAASPTEAEANRFVEFADVTSQAGFSLAKLPTHGLAWGDFDGDGWVDLYINHHAKRPQLMRNQHDGTFLDVTDSAGMDALTDRHDCAWADFNADGKLDLYCAAGAQRGKGSKPNQLWQNNGDGTFRDVAAQFKVADDFGRGRTLSWLDYNQDGALDLFVGNQLDENLQSTNRLFRNDGGVFTDVAASSGLGKRFGGIVSAVSDYNQDNSWDLAVATDNEIFLFMNNGNGSFRQKTPKQTGLYAKSVRALAWGDYDNDGYADLFVAAADGASKLFHNDRNGHFTDVTSAANLRQTNQYPAADALWADLDNDGWLDLFIVRQSPSHATNNPDIVWRNNGNGVFTDVTTRARLAGPTRGQGDSAAAADYDNDGFLDLFVTNGKNPQGAGYLYHNLANRQRWLTIRLLGSGANPAALGSKIWLTSGGKTQYREYLDGSAGRSQSQVDAHFGLGKETRIQSIKIQWPNLQIQELTDIAADQILVISQP